MAKKNFRQDARTALLRAKEELKSSDLARMRYAALELRMAMEGLTYDRAQAFRKEIPPSEYNTWQPRKVMQMLLEIDPNADKRSTLSVGIEEEYGKPAKEMEVLGTEKVLDLATLKRHYDALGATLHMPTLKQIEEGGRPDLAKLRSRCETIAADIEAALASSVFNITLGNFAELECVRCSKPVRKRMPHGAKSVDAKCFHCGADYRVTDAGAGKTRWEPLRQEFKCPTHDCDASVVIWRDEIKAGTCWKCPKCAGRYYLGLAILKDQKPQDVT